MWSSWNDSDASAAGTVWAHVCVPYCAASTKYDYYPATITLSDIKNVGAVPYFTQMTIYYWGAGPNGQKTQQVGLLY